MHQAWDQCEISHSFHVKRFKAIARMLDMIYNTCMQSKNPVITHSSS